MEAPLPMWCRLRRLAPCWNFPEPTQRLRMLSSTTAAFRGSRPIRGLLRLPTKVSQPPSSCRPAGSETHRALRHPHFKLRRLAGYVSKTFRKLGTAGNGATRTIAACPTIPARADKPERLSHGRTYPSQKLADQRGKTWPKPEGATNLREYRIYRLESGRRREPARRHLFRRHGRLRADGAGCAARASRTRSTRR